MKNIIIVQALKEWQEFRRDKLSLALAFILPIFSLLLFGYGIRLESKSIPIVVEDHDNSSLSREYVARLYATNMFVPAPRSDEKSMTYDIQRGAAKMAFEIPDGFAKRIFRGENTDLKVMLDGTDIANVQVLSNIVEAVNLHFLAMLKKMRQPDGELAPVHPELRLWFNPARLEKLFIVPGALAVVLWMYPALLSAVAASREKEQETIIRVYATRPNAAGFLLGKAVPYFVISILMAALVIAFAAIVFGSVPIGDPTPLLVTTPIYVMTSVLFGLCLGTYANSQTIAVQATSSIGFFPCLLLSGFVYPIANIPFPLSLVSVIVPARYFVILSRDAFVRGAGWDAVWFVPLILSLFCVVFFVLSWLVLRPMQLKD